MVQLVSVDRRTVLTFNVENTIPLSWLLETEITLPIAVLPVNVDTNVVETERVETVRVERVAEMP